MTVDWVKKQDRTWYKLDELTLNGSYFDGLTGVYDICHGGNTPQTVKVGQGDIGDRLQAHRLDQAVQYYAPLGLYVTWASIQANSIDGVEVFLAQELRPLVGERYPDAIPIKVNLP